jgi:hypothetical protein
VSINAGASFDLGDDLEGKDAGEIMSKVIAGSQAARREPIWKKGAESAVAQ